MIQVLRQMQSKKFVSNGFYRSSGKKKVFKLKRN